MTPWMMDIWKSSKIFVKKKEKNNSNNKIIIVPSGIFPTKQEPAMAPAEAPQT